MNKKILAIPIGDQYEQICNAAALKKLGVKTLHTIEEDFEEEIKDWLEEPLPNYAINFEPTKNIVDVLMELNSQKNGPQLLNKKTNYQQKFSYN